MTPTAQVIVTIVGSILASSGLWAWVMKKSEKKDVKTKMLVELAHDRILSLFTAVAVSIMSAQIGGLPIAVFALASEVTLDLKNTLILYKGDLTTTLTATEITSA